MTVFAHGLTTDLCIALSDAELVERTFAAISAIADEATELTHCDMLADRLFFLVDELLERFAPDVALTDLKRRYADDSNTDNLLDAIGGLRRRQAARLLRDTIGGDDA